MPYLFELQCRIHLQIGTLFASARGALQILGSIARARLGARHGAHVIVVSNVQTAGDRMT